MRLGKRVVERNCLTGGSILRGKSGSGIELAFHCAGSVVVGESRPTERVVGLDFGGFPEVFAGFVILTRDTRDSGRADRRRVPRG